MTRTQLVIIRFLLLMGGFATVLLATSREFDQTEGIALMCIAPWVLIILLLGRD